MDFKVKIGTKIELDLVIEGDDKEPDNVEDQKEKEEKNSSIGVATKTLAGAASAVLIYVSTGNYDAIIAWLKALAMN